MNVIIGKNQCDNETLFDNALEHHTWFHIADLPSAHLWLDTTVRSITKNQLYQTALQLKKKSKYSKMKYINIVYAEKNQLQKTNVPGKLVISGKSKIIKV